ncbi:Beta-lactamase [Parvularcula bermudensis HTCC2503]|uniref:Beta-lactamase n=1 Tax=Parvularcula bermudensis (strain ATCC BAA-594 / HTCC2503 / KCTC 12087) TaxID=314260 RepID=E0TG07_PARBH|nr:serine hydrolase domain-containing protein [Parvularcula bermudensis]ADM10126.1 Beta-lactamase [Parvularcula bermudensis HTCC2503]
MQDLTPTGSASDLGFDPDRLDAIPAFFDAYLSSGRLPNLSLLIARHGEIAHFSAQGHQAMTDGSPPIDQRTIYRIYSMTKPVTSVAVMMLAEEGRLHLGDPLFKYLPAFKKMTVWDEQGDHQPAKRPITLRDLMTHQAGFTYSFLMQHRLDALYRERDLDPIAGPLDLETFCDRLAELPLLFSPGERWNYSVATDVLGRVVEVVSGQSLPSFFSERIFGPLGMVDTGFHVADSELSRLSALYQRDPVTKDISLYDGGGAASATAAKAPSLPSGGGGLYSTMADYYRFCRFLLGKGSLGGIRLLSPKTMDFMSLNHLPGGKTMGQMGDKTFSEARMEGSGFGLGFAVVTDMAAQQQPSSLGTFSWGGLASTYFWIDPTEELIGLMMTQLIPSSAYPIRPQLQALTYAAITGP